MNKSAWQGKILQLLLKGRIRIRFFNSDILVRNGSGFFQKFTGSSTLVLTNLELTLECITIFSFLFPYEQLTKSLTSEDVDLIYRKSSAHQLESPPDLELFLITLDRLAQLAITLDRFI